MTFAEALQAMRDGHAVHCPEIPDALIYMCVGKSSHFINRPDKMYQKIVAEGEYLVANHKGTFHVYYPVDEDTNHNHWQIAEEA